MITNLNLGALIKITGPIEKADNWLGIQNEISQNRHLDKEGSVVEVREREVYVQFAEHNTCTYPFTSVQVIDNNYGKRRAPELFDTVAFSYHDPKFNTDKLQHLYKAKSLSGTLDEINGDIGLITLDNHIAEVPLSELYVIDHDPYAKMRFEFRKRLDRISGQPSMRVCLKDTKKKNGARINAEKYAWLHLDPIDDSWWITTAEGMGDMGMYPAEELDYALAEYHPIFSPESQKIAVNGLNEGIKSSTELAPFTVCWIADKLRMIQGPNWEYNHTQLITDINLLVPIYNAEQYPKDVAFLARLRTKLSA